MGEIWYNRGMIDYYSIPENELPMSMRFLRKKLKQTGWRAEKLCRESQNNLILTRPDGVTIRVASSTPPTTSVYALRLADNKMMSYELLHELGVSQPETVAVRTAEEVQPMIEKYGAVAIKPIDGAHGNGVTVGVRDAEQAKLAIEKAVAASPEMQLAIAQPQLPIDELEQRVICIDYKFVVAIARIPAQVTGDGRSTIAELIAHENATIRTEPYQGELAYIDPEAAERFLGEKMSLVPAAGERVRVVASCNVGQGGTAEDRSAEFSVERRELAEKIARAAQLPVVGIDYYGDQVIEINACPSLYYPTGDESAWRAVDAYIEYLAKI